MESSFGTAFYTSQTVPKLHVRDMYVAGTVLGMTSPDGRTDGRTDTTGHFTPQTGTSPRGLTPLSRAQERKYSVLRQLSSTGRRRSAAGHRWTPQAIKSATTTYYYHLKTWKNRKGQKTAGQRFKMTDWLCEAKPILHNGLALRSKAIQSKWIGFAKQSQSIIEKALRSKANPS